MRHILVAQKFDDKVIEDFWCLNAADVTTIFDDGKPHVFLKLSKPLCRFDEYMILAAHNNQTFLLYGSVQVLTYELEKWFVQFEPFQIFSGC